MASTWRKFKKEKTYPKLNKNLKVDVVIIGGGMAGILNAYRLSKSGLKVALVEKKSLGTYATMDTTAFITKVIDTDLSKTAEIYDDKTAKLVWQSGQEAVEEFERIIEKEGIDCEFVRCSNFIYASTKKQFDELKEEYEEYKRLKIKAELHPDPTRLNFRNYGYIEVPGQAKFHPSKFLFALAEIASRNGVQIFENTAAKKISGDDPVVIETTGGKVEAGRVIIATYKPIDNEKTHLKKAMYRSYIVEARIGKGIFPEGIYEDNSNPYTYFRIDPQEDYDRMIFGGEDHKDIFGKTLLGESMKGLKKKFAKIIGKHHYSIVTEWNGPILEPSDGLALIGEIKPNYYVATGFSGNGMTYSMISSMLIGDLIMGERNPWQKVYDPKRALLVPKRLASKAKDYIEEFVGGALKNLLT